MNTSERADFFGCLHLSGLSSKCILCHTYEREPGDYVIMHMTEGVHWNNNKSFGGLVGLKMGFLGWII